MPFSVYFQIKIHSGVENAISAGKTLMFWRWKLASMTPNVQQCNITDTMTAQPV